MGGQQSSTTNETVICCTTREHDEARPGESLVSSCQANESPQRRQGAKSAKSGGKEDGAFDDGGTGGTGAQHVRDENALCDGGRAFNLSAFACVEDRSGDLAAGRRALFGDKSLKPKLVRLRNYEVEVEALMQIRANLAKRLPAEAGKAVAVPAPLEAGTSVIPEAELIRRLRLHEESLAGVPEKFVTQACERVLGSSESKSLVDKPVDLKEMKAHYAEILSTVDSLVQERISHLHNELTKLDSEVGELEDLIALCWKTLSPCDAEVGELDEEVTIFVSLEQKATGKINSVAFVDFVCEQETVEHEQEGAIAVSEEDAESLFIQMSRGQGELTFVQFKDEITAGCLQVMHHNLGMRREIQKRYRYLWG